MVSGYTSSGRVFEKNTTCTKNEVFKKSELWKDTEEADYLLNEDFCCDKKTGNANGNQG